MRPTDHPYPLALTTELPVIPGALRHEMPLRRPGMGEAGALRRRGARDDGDPGSATQRFTLHCARDDEGGGG